jgi:predicted glycosyltransferase
MGRYLFTSHDGFGLGHVRRNVLIARAILRRDRTAEVTVVTGIPSRPRWLTGGRLQVVGVPALLKDGDGVYRNPGLEFHEVIAERARIVAETVERFRPDVVVVDRHPFGTAGELRPGLAAARRAGAHVVLGLRDIIDEPEPVRREIAGSGWDGVGDVFDRLLVFGDPALCDHAREYGLEHPVTYCGWVVEQPRRRRPDPDLVVVSAGGGGDGAAVFDLAVEAIRQRPRLRAIVAAGPYAGRWDHPALTALGDRVRLVHDGGATARWLSHAGAAVQMAGYNSTVECLVAGIRPVLVPRRAPRREQAIRAGRLAFLGLADMVDESAAAEEVAWLLDRPRQLPAGACAAAGLRFDGAERAAELLAVEVGSGSAAAPGVRV